MFPNPSRSRHAFTFLFPLLMSAGIAALAFAPPEIQAEPVAPPGDPLKRLAGEVEPAAVVDIDAALTQSALRVVRDGRTFELPLIDTEVDAAVSGFVADVAVHQLYSNPFDEPIEAVYLFPLPDGAAVNDMQMRIGDRLVVGEIKRREEAQQIYEDARDAGKTAALLDQERPNVFQQAVANILPGEAVEISIHFVQRLNYEDGGYEWAFPMVVGPRFIPAQGTGNSGGTTPSEDAQRLSAPVSPTRTGHDIKLNLSLDAGLPIQALRSPSHKIDISRPTRSEAEVALHRSDRIPNKDFVLRYDVAGQAPDIALLTHRSSDEGYFMLTLQPQADEHLRDEVVTPKEMVFVLDTSCSQSGEPLERSKEAVELAISEMNPQDRFWILNFNNSVSSLSPTSLPNTAANRRRGIDYIRGFRGQGGTNMLEGIRAALDLPTQTGMLRTVVFMTDGYIGNETQILAEIEQRLGNSRLFSFGVGSSTNRYLLNQMAKVGRGHVQYIRQDEDPSTQVHSFYDRIRNPVLTDIDVSWNGVELTDIYPDPIPDLFSAQPLVLTGKYKHPGKGTITVTGKIAGRPYSQKVPLTLPSRQVEHASLSSLWARTVIDDLESRRLQGADKTIQEEIIQLALKHRLMTKETSFVAVEERVVTDPNGHIRRVRVPLETPEGVEHAAIFDGKVDTTASAPLHLGLMRSSGGRSQASGFSARGMKAEAGGAAAYPRRKTIAPRSEDIAFESIRESTKTARSDRATSGEVEVHSADASLSRSNRRLIERRLRGLRSSWTTALRSGQASGRWTVEVDIDGDGQVLRVRLLKDDLGLANLAALFQRQAMTWKLSATPSGTSETLRFELRFSAER